MELTARLALVVAVFTTGLMAGLYFAFSVAVMPGLARSGDRTLVEAMQRINAAILNAPFGLAFGGALVCGVLALAAHWPAPMRAAAPGALGWIAAGVTLYAVTLVVTFAVNVPLNDALAAAGPVVTSDDAAAAARAAFEARWVAFTLVRTVAAAGSFGCLLTALAVGRTA